MNRSHKIRLHPNNVQATYFAKACGCARFTYNWALNEWKTQYEAGGKPTANDLKKKFTALKKIEFPFISEVTKCAPEQAFANLGKAFKSFFRNMKLGRKPGYPRFKKRRLNDSFYISNDKFRIMDKKIWIPKLGWVRMTEELRYTGKIMSAAVSKTADMWFVSISVELADTVAENQGNSSVGIDLGINKLATLSDGTVFENIKSTKQYEGRLRLLNKSLARKQRGSNNRYKAVIRLSRLHYRISCVRNDHIHKMTSYVAAHYKHVCIEDLHVKGMVKNRHLSKAISDCSFAEIRRQLEYKCRHVHLVDRWFPSTKLCPECGTKNDMPLNKRLYSCECGYGPIDRDLHAANNILRQGLASKPVETRALA